MIPFLPLAFAQPLILISLLALPALWWLLRLTPPQPKRVAFPPTRLLLDVAPKEETPSRTPWWLLLLRLLAAALIILAAAGPVLNPLRDQAAGTKPLVILIDDGWSAAATWDLRIKTADELIAAAEGSGQPVAVVPLSGAARDITLQPAGAARVAMRQLAPAPHAIERTRILAPLGRWLATQPDVDLVWLSDATRTVVDEANAEPFVNGLKDIAGNRKLTIYDRGAPAPLALAAVENAPAFMSVKVLRAQAGAAGSGIVRALDRVGAPLGDAPFTLASGSREAEARFELPSAIRNEIARLDIVGERSAGAVQLVDRRWRRRTIGVVSGATSDMAQPLLAATFYLARALRPFADTRVAERAASSEAIAQFLDQKIPILILADVGRLPGDLRQRLDSWIENGGVLVRFAGPRLAASQDPLVPVRLREGGRTLGGALTWEKPQPLASFAANGPFAGLKVPDDVTVTRQVLAEPDERLSAKSWATLGDGTPLVTGERRGRGALVLFHVNANTRWSNLPLSGTFVEMLQRIAELGGAATAETTGAGVAADSAKLAPAETLNPLQTLNGFGIAGPPPVTARPVAGARFVRADADHPPGFYGEADSPLALNALGAGDRLAPIDFSPLNARHGEYRDSAPRDLRGLLLAAALLLFAVDAIAAAWLSGRLARIVPARRARGAAAALLLALAFGSVAFHTPALAQSPFSAPRDVAESSDPLAVTRKTRLAYVRTGNAEVDEIARAGLSGLTLYLAQRTALEGGEPVGVDPSRDELAFYPLIYWPVSADTPPASREALARIEAYMKQGGTVLFDTRDAIEQLPGEGGPQSPSLTALRTILSSLDVPELEPVPREHVLAKTFYLLRDFPGRFTSGRLWVEALPRVDDEEAGERPARSGDGVSSIIITSNDLAGAWAMRPDGQPMLPLTPGEPRQRDMAFRAGVNIVMYTLTGNYKADQVHAPALIERLGQ